MKWRAKRWLDCTIFLRIEKIIKNFRRNSRTCYIYPTDPNTNRNDSFANVASTKTIRVRQLTTKTSNSTICTRILYFVYVSAFLFFKFYIHNISSHQISKQHQVDSSSLSHHIIPPSHPGQVGKHTQLNTTTPNKHANQCHFTTHD